MIASSDKVYGNCVRATEDSPLNGINPYDASKICADVIARSYAKTYGLPVVVSRCSNIYGPGDRHMSRIVPSTVASALAEKDIEIRSDGKALREYTYISDAVDAYLLLAESAQKYSGQAFNFGSGEVCSVITLVRKILHIAGSQSDVRILGTDKNYIRRQSLDSSKAQKLLGWSVKVSLTEGLEKTIDAARREIMLAPAQHPTKRPIWPF